jgi:uncharacterized Zn-binding protein involved in type VI secretion
MAKVTVNPPKTPVTRGSNGTAAATIPNVCKMPGPPAPFVPTPLPNIGTSDDSPEGYSTTVTIEGQPVAIKGASFKSKGDVASQGTGGGIVSSNVQGPTKFIAPGSMDVKIEGTRCDSDDALHCQGQRSAEKYRQRPVSSGQDEGRKGGLVRKLRYENEREDGQEQPVVDHVSEKLTYNSAFRDRVGRLS